MSATDDTPTITVLSERADLRDEFVDAVRDGLRGEEKTLPCKFLYDGRGSEIFEEITELPEYYLTRAESDALERHASDIVAKVKPDELLELGSGASRKTELLLEAVREHGGSRYVGLDISPDAVREATDRLAQRHDWLSVHGAVGDFHEDLANVDRSGRRLICFLGSTIGNLDPTERAEFFSGISAALEPGDGFLLGVDLVKDPAALLAAYDDSAGVTASFTKNMLVHLNRELDGDLPVDAFRHVARYNVGEERIEISLRAEREIDARIEGADTDVRMERGEEIAIEISSKFTRTRVTGELTASGMALSGWWTDAEGRFALALARAA